MTKKEAEEIARIVNDLKALEVVENEVLALFNDINFRVRSGSLRMVNSGLAHDVLKDELKEIIDDGIARCKKVIGDSKNGLHNQLGLFELSKPYEKQRDVTPFCVESGGSYKCVVPVVMDGGWLAYYQGKIYKSAQDHCITNETGDINHWWSDEDAMKYFVRVDKEHQ